MKTFFKLLGTLSLVRSKDNTLEEGFAPYASAGCSRLYNMFFCDKPEVYRTEFESQSIAPWAELLVERPQLGVLRTIARDAAIESCARLLAYHRLRESREPIRERKLLGVVVEVGSEQGLEVIAAYADGNVSYIDQAEGVRRLASRPETHMARRALMQAAQTAVDRIGPWLQPRVAPPSVGMIRMSFLVSDGLYFGQGLLSVMQADELAAPIIAASEALRAAVVDVCDPTKIT